MRWSRATLFCLWLLATTGDARRLRNHSDSRQPTLKLRGGARPAANPPSSLVALREGQPFLPRLEKAVDAALSGIGLAATFAVMGMLGPKLGVNLVAPPMMASGIIFFSPLTPPNPKGFLSGTVGCASVSAALYSLVSSGAMGVPAAQGVAAGALLVWYKITGVIFPPAAVLCVLMAGVPSGTGFRT